MLSLFFLAKPILSFLGSAGLFSAKKAELFSLRVGLLKALRFYLHNILVEANSICY